MHRATLWVFANVAWIAVSPAAALYFDRQQRNGAYPVDADSIGLPIMGIAVWVIVLLLPLNFVWWFLLRRYPGRVSLRISGKGLGTWKRFIGVLGLIFAVSCSAAAVWALREGAGEVSPVFFTWSYITLAMRAAYLVAIQENGQASESAASSESEAGGDC
jgi:hypothetical protein